MKTFSVIEKWLKFIVLIYINIELPLLDATECSFRLVTRKVTSTIKHLASIVSLLWTFVVVFVYIW